MSLSLCIWYLRSKELLGRLFSRGNLPRI
ncbi:hypothetical protein JMJ77_0008171 [Colletotrichum scovillei]|uniref:Uncharacterized protein n=1 Tax=Colletotrichum scovillei TaxID=1209932 RepID=A0A9P7UGM9_9PEZI|nr:hypothetical protein JMJ77_0008171 [Colletotrichum scovillei]KAG7075163.1 hypothetical protein JMJ76_0011625 [Colletotrichum scovillei]KAG7082133.1 hypothetical protein JMJ78_0004238 [Colletotrichum scovillei]